MNMFRIGQRSRSGRHHSGDDEAHLARIGRKPAIRRKYGAWTMFAFSCIVLEGWAGVLFTFQIGYVNGGSAGLVYGYVIAWLGTMATFASLAEMSSMAPVSAGQYYWSAMVWPREWANLISYVTGWMMVLGWQAAVASGAFAAGLLTQMFIQVVDPDYVPELWHTTLLYYAALLLALVANVFSGKPLTWIQSGAFVLYLCGFLGVMVTVVVLSDHADATTVFTSFENGGGWSSEGLSFMVGLAGVAFDFLGADCVYHMSEEVHNARIVVPWAITSAIGVGGFIGIIALIGLLFCIPDPETVLASEYAYPFAAVFLQATKSRAGSSVMIMVIIVLQLAAVAALLPTAARMLWAFARDKGVPLSSLLGKVHDRSSIPRNAILVTVTISTLVGLISLGSPLAFNDLVSLTISAVSVSYLLACLGLLLRRLSGAIELFNDHSTELVNIPGSEKKLAWGPWHIPGIWGTLVNAWACVYLIVIFFFSFWPTATPVSPSSMNYSVLLFGAVALLSTGYYLLRGKKTFKGPAVDVSVLVESYEHEEKR